MTPCPSPPTCAILEMPPQGGLEEQEASGGRVILPGPVSRAVGSLYCPGPRKPSNQERETTPMTGKTTP